MSGETTQHFEEENLLAMSITSTGASDFERKLKRKRTSNRAVGYTVEEVAAMLRVAKNCIYEAVARGEIPSVKVGRLVRIPAGPFHSKFGELNPSK
jgi:excisionase family DNA binding protein